MRTRVTFMRGMSRTDMPSLTNEILRSRLVTCHIYRLSIRSWHLFLFDVRLVGDLWDFISNLRWKVHSFLRCLTWWDEMGWDIRFLSLAIMATAALVSLLCRTLNHRAKIGCLFVAVFFLSKCRIYLPSWYFPAYFNVKGMVSCLFSSMIGWNG